VPNRNAGPGMPPRVEAASDSPIIRVQQDPRIEKLRESVDFNAQNYALALAAGAGSVVAGPTFQVPQNQVGWLQSSGLYLLTPTAATSVTLQIRINSGPVPGFDNLQNVPGIANFVVFPLEDDMRVRIPNNALVETFIFNNNANGPWTVGAFLSGWYHPLAAEEQAWGGGR
jgi:hypothetical protein